MRRIAVIGGGIAGLAAAYELEQQRRSGVDIAWTLFEASDRCGGTVETTRVATVDGEFVLEGGPDAWVTDKPWARDLAVELGLEADLIVSNDATRKTYVLVNDVLEAMPDRMRMMVPEDLATLRDSPLFSKAAQNAYADELARATELRLAAPANDESVASFVRRHFGGEVLQKIGAPLLSGVFGGDVDRLSVRSVMPAFVAMERDHGSLIAAVQAKARERGDRPASATFTTLRRGMGSLVEALLESLPFGSLRSCAAVTAMQRTSTGWLLQVGSAPEAEPFDNVLLAAPTHVAASLLAETIPEAADLMPKHASSAVLAAFGWTSAAAASFSVPPGFGFLVPQKEPAPDGAPAILACTFVDQKFPNRTPAGDRAIRVFYGDRGSEALAARTDDEVAEAALLALEAIFGCGKLPPPAVQSIRRWPRSLPQYEVGHLDRMKKLDALVEKTGALALLGNGYRGVGVPDLIRDARTAAARVAQVEGSERTTS